MLLRKGVYPYEYMKNLMKNYYVTKKLFTHGRHCTCLHMEDIADVDYSYAKRIFKKLNNKNLGDYQDDIPHHDTFNIERWHFITCWCGQNF